MKNIGKNIGITLMLVICMMLSMGVSAMAETEHSSHCECVGIQPTGHTCPDNQQWTPWGDDPSETGLPTTEGHYYLTKDVVLSSGYTTQSNDGEVVLCLNGHDVSRSNGGPVITVRTQPFTLTDCSSGENTGKITGGYNITGTDSSGGGGVLVRNSFTMYNGHITGNKAKYGAGINMYGSSAILNLYGGMITGNEVPENTSSGVGGGIRFGNGGQFHIEGSPVISGNMDRGKRGNIYLTHPSCFITVSDKGLGDILLSISFSTSNGHSVVAKNVKSDDVEKFVSEILTRDFWRETNGDVVIGDHIHSWEYIYTGSEGTQREIQVKCVSNTCQYGTKFDAQKGAVIDICTSDKEAFTHRAFDYDYTSEPVSMRLRADIVEGLGLPPKPTIEYYERDDLSTSIEAPADVGKYRAQVTYGSCTDWVDYNINPVTPVCTGQGIASGTYGDKLSDLKVSGLTVTFKGETVIGTWSLLDDDSYTGDKIFNVADSGKMVAAQFTPASSNFKPFVVNVALNISKAKLTAVTVPEDLVLHSLCTDAQAVIDLLPNKLTYTVENGSTVDVRISWSNDDYRLQLGASNEFSWEITDPAVMANHELDQGVSGAGSILVRTTDAKPSGLLKVLEHYIDDEVIMQASTVQGGRYQWYVNRNDGKGFVPMLGENSAVLRIAAVQLEQNNYQFCCLIFDAGGDVMSSVYQLHVSPRPPQTGDSFPLYGWLALMCISVLSLARASHRLRAKQYAENQ